MGAEDDGDEDTDTLEPDDEAALWADDPDGVYEIYEVMAHYKNERNQYACASTKPGEKAKVIQMANPQLRVRYEWSLSRLGSPPVIPDPNAVPADVLPLDDTITTNHVELAADGVTCKYLVVGIYDYEFLDPATANVGFTMPPFLSATLNTEAQIGLTNMSGDILFPPLPGTRGVTNPFAGLGTEEEGQPE